MLINRFIRYINRNLLPMISLFFTGREASRSISLVPNRIPHARNIVRNRTAKLDMETI